MGRPPAARAGPGAAARPASASASSTGPSISVSGVRNSWLTLEKNAVFARSSSASASARRRSSSYARALATRRADLAGHEVEEAPVGVVETPARADAERRAGRPGRLSGRGTGRTTARLGGSGQGEPGRGPASQRRSRTSSARPVRSTAASGQGVASPAASDARGRERVILGQAGRRDQARAVARLVERRRWPRTGGRAGPPRAPAPPRAGRPDGARLRRLDAELAERLQPPGPDHLVGDLGAGAEDALDRAAVGREDRAVGEADVDLLAREVPLEEEQEVVRPGRRPGAADALEHRPDGVPDLGPDLPRPAARGCPGAWPAEERDVGVVVEDVQVRPPPDQDGEAGGEAEADGGPQVLRPATGRAEVGRRPVEGAHPPRELALAREEPPQLFAAVADARPGPPPRSAPSALMARPFRSHRAAQVALLRRLSRRAAPFRAATRREGGARIGAAA